MQRFGLGLSVCAALLISSPARADLLFTFTDFANVTGGGTTTGTVKVSQTAAQALAGTVSIDVEGTFNWADTGAGEHDQFFFNIQGTASGVTPSLNISFTSPTTGWKLDTDPKTFDIPSDGFTDLFAFGLTCAYSGGACDKNGNTGVSPPLKFDVIAPGLTPNSFNVPVTDKLGNTGIVFVADATVKTQTGTTNTGLIGATRTVPDGGGTLMLLGGVLFGVETLRRRLCR